MTGITVQPNKAIVGANAFAHEAGIHQDGMLKDRETYEIMTPQSVGWEESKLVLGKHSGRAGFNAKLIELGYSVERDTLQNLYERFIALTDRKKTVSDADIIAIVEDNLQRVSGDVIVKLLEWRAGSASSGQCEAAVMLEINGREREATGRGNGQVDALYTAVDALVDIQPKLEHLHVEAVTSSADAQGTVLTRVRVGDEVYTGQAVSTDIIAASLDSYIQAINRALVAQASRTQARATKREAV
jgi:2-isopropylmalate synthase